MTTAPTAWTEDPQLRVVLSTAPPDQAQPLALALVESGAAACVNLVPGIRSIYRWKGAIANDPETLLVIKTRTDALDALRTALAEHHSYEVPEIVGLGVTGAAQNYADWVAASVESAGESDSDPTGA